MASRAQRTGENEAWFREVNELLESRAVELSDGSFRVVCECAREECTERIETSFAEYERVRARPDTFIIVRGHSDLRYERVVETSRTHEVVEKFGAAATAAASNDPRDRGAGWRTDS